MKTFPAALFLAVSASAAFAGQTYDTAGKIKATSAAEIIPLSENHMVMLSPSTHDSFDMVDKDHPFTDMTGSCSGGVEFLNGAALGHGICAYENSAGEKMAVRWSGESIAADGTFHGNWSVIGGTGKLEGAVGGGDFSSVTDRSSGAQDITLTGAITTK